jgi:hypothetical protein
MNYSENIELLTIEEYAKRFGVCRTTIFEWKKRGKLQAGRHFIKIGRVLRFFWSLDVLKDLHDVDNQRFETTARHGEPIDKCKKNNKKCAIDFEY